MRVRSGSQEILPGTTSLSSWPLFLLVVVQLAVAVVTEDRVGQEEFLVSIPAQGFRYQSFGALNVV